jgi:thioesterase domain-containing protein
MQGIDEFLTELRHQGVQLWAEGDRLRYKAPKETLTPVLLQGLRERKAEILEFLQAANVPAPEVSLVPIQKHGSKPPLFCIYGIFVYYDLACHLGADQPVYGVYIQDEVDSHWNSNSGKLPIKSLSVVELATRYLKEIRKQQPVGPYLLAGLSFGGLVAFEIAQQLTTQGEQVALLTLFDTSAPGEYQELSIQQRLSLHLQGYRQHGHSYILEKINKRIYNERQKIASLLHQAPPKLGEDSNSNGFFDPKTSIFSRASKTYQAQAYPGKIMLFQALDDACFRAPATTSSKWQELAAGGLELHAVPGNHLGILKEPNVAILAQKLTLAIDRALENLPVSSHPYIESQAGTQPPISSRYSPASENRQSSNLQTVRQQILARGLAG